MNVMAKHKFIPLCYTYTSELSIMLKSVHDSAPTKQFHFHSPAFLMTHKTHLESLRNRRDLCISLTLEDTHKSMLYTYNI